MKNRFYIVEDEVYIKLASIYGNHWTIIDLEDLDLIMSFNHLWIVQEYGRTNRSKRHYAAHTVSLGGTSNKYVFMHNIIMQHDFVNSHLEVDHHNTYSLDNRKFNLRLVTRQLNSFNSKLSAANTSSVKGVARHKPTEGWRAYITPNNKQIHLGLFPRKKQAIRARKRAEIEVNNALEIWNKL